MKWSAASAFLGLTLVFGFTLCFSCGADNFPEGHDVDGGPESSKMDGGGDLTIELGTGETGFQAITGGQELPLILGPQGTGRTKGYHIWGAVRTRDLDASRHITLRFSVDRISDGAQIAMSQWEKRLQPTIQGDEFYALQVILYDCCEARGQVLRMAVTAQDFAGQVASAEVLIVGGSKCGDADGREICP